MKLKITILLTFVFIISVNVFGQKPETKTETKTPETKPTPAAKLPTVKDVLGKYLEAVGGREASEKIQTRLTKGSVEISPMGIKGTVETYAAAPDKTYSKMNIGGIGEALEGYDGKIAWSSSPLQGDREKTGAELLQTKLLSTFHRESNFEKLYPKMEVKGVEKIGDKEAYVVFAQPVGLEAQTFYFDRQTGLLLREDAVVTSPEGSMPMKIFYDDYRAVDGVKVPFKMRTVLPQFELIIALTEVKNGVKIDEALFSKPKQ